MLARHSSVILCVMNRPLEEIWMLGICGHLRIASLGVVGTCQAHSSSLLREQTRALLGCQPLLMKLEALGGGGGGARV